MLPEIEARFMTADPLTEGRFEYSPKVEPADHENHLKHYPSSYSFAILKITFYNRNAYHHRQYLRYRK